MYWSNKQKTKCKLESFRGLNVHWTSRLAVYPVSRLSFELSSSPLDFCVKLFIQEWDCFCVWTRLRSDHHRQALSLPPLPMERLHSNLCSSLQPLPWHQDPHCTTAWLAPLRPQPRLRRKQSLGLGMDTWWTQAQGSVRRAQDLERLGFPLEVSLLGQWHLNSLQQSS